MPPKNQLYYGDNLEVLREHIADESVDLVYLDPPFNSNATYNVLFKSRDGDNSQAQIEAFDDTWHWGVQAEEQYEELTRGRTTIEVATFIQTMRTVLGTSDMLAYLLMMAPRLIEMRRVMNQTASIYLHCDPTASHYLKLLMDAVFGPQHFQNEIVWERTNAHNMKTKAWPRTNDSILFYTKSDQFVFNQQFTEYGPEQLKRFKPDDDGRLYKAENLTFSTANPSRQFEWRGTKPPSNRSWGMSIEDLESLYAEGRILLKKDGRPRMDGWKIYLDETKGKPVTSNWTDISRISNTAAERLGYPTQKPLALLARIISASSDPGSAILDPFCGCGTATDAAQDLGRRWIGIDVTYIAIDLIIKRLQHRYGDEILSTFTTNGIPKDIQSADALFERNPFDFERWAVSLIDGQPNDKQVGDRGVDGRIRFDAGSDAAAIAIVSVKGGQQLNPAMVRDLEGTMRHENSELAILITRFAPTRGMLEVAETSGMYQLPKTLSKFPRIQILTVPELLEGKRPKMPPVYPPYIRAKRKPDSEAVPLF